MSTVLKIHERDNAVIARPEIAKFDLELTAQLREELTQVSSGSEGKPLLIDLSVVDVLPSVTIGALVELANRCRKDKRSLALIRLQPKVLEILRVCALDKLFTIHADEAEALASL